MLKVVSLDLTGIPENKWPAMSEGNRDSLRSLAQVIDSGYEGLFAPIYKITTEWPDDVAVPTGPVTIGNGTITVEDYEGESK